MAISRGSNHLPIHHAMAITTISSITGVRDFPTGHLVLSSVLALQLTRLGRGEFLDDLLGQFFLRCELALDALHVAFDCERYVHGFSRSPSPGTLTAFLN